MILIKTASEIKKMKEAGRVAAIVLDKMAKLVKPGVTTYDLDQLAYSYMQELGGESACYQYKAGQKFFPSYTCISINNEVVHGVASKSRVLMQGDIVSLDVSVIYGGYVGDNAKTVIIPPVSKEIEHLVFCTEKALYLAIEQAKPGNRVGNISFAVQSFIEKEKLSVVKEFVGHGIGKNIHEEPQIPNYISTYHAIRKTPLLKAGMTLAIEPMVNIGKSPVKTGEDGWTIMTMDDSFSAHFEHTILITNNQPEILTMTNNCL